MDACGISAWRGGFHAEQVLFLLDQWWGKESYTECIRLFGKTLQKAQPGTEAVYVLQGVCRVSAGKKVEQHFLLWLHNVLFLTFLSLCKSVHSAPKKTKPLSKQEGLTYMCSVFLGCQNMLLGSKPESLGGLAGVFFGRLLLEIAAETFSMRFFLSITHISSRNFPRNNNIFSPKYWLARNKVLQPSLKLFN